MKEKTFEIRVTGKLTVSFTGEEWKNELKDYLESLTQDPEFYLADMDLHDVNVVEIKGDLT